MSLNLDRSTWRRVKFGDVVRNVNESVKDPDSAGIDRVIGLEHLDPGELKIDRWGELTEETTFTRRVKPGQTLFGKRRAYQRKTAYAEFDAVCSGDILVFESADEGALLPELLPFIAMTDGFYTKALETSAGSLSPRTRWSDLATYEFDLPPLADQRRIADLLWAVEGHIRGCRAAIQSIQECTNSLVDEIIWVAAARRVPLRELDVRGTLSDGDWIESKDMDENGTVRLLQLADIGVGSFLNKSNRWISQAVAKSLGVSRLSVGDLMISRMAEPIGRTCAVPDLGCDAITAVDVAVLVPRSGIPPGWILAVLNSRRWTDEVLRRARGTTRVRVSRRDLEGVLVPDPFGSSVMDQDSAIRSLSEAKERSADELSKLLQMRLTILTELGSQS